jgi:hypothetical protein
MNWRRNPQLLLQNFKALLMSGSVFELPFDTRQKACDQGAGRMSEATHLGCLDDLHRGAQDLVPSFAHASPGMRESWVNANKELGDLTLIGMANAGSRFGNNNDAINKFFNGNGGHSEEAASTADGSLDNFLAGRSQVAATHIDTSKNRLNSNYGMG